MTLKRRHVSINCERHVGRVPLGDTSEVGATTPFENGCGCRTADKGDAPVSRLTDFGHLGHELDTDRGKINHNGLFPPPQGLLWTKLAQCLHE